MFLEEGQWTFDLWDWASLLEGWHPENLQSQGWSLFVQMGQHHDQNVKNIPNLRYSIRLVIHKTWPVLSVFLGVETQPFPPTWNETKLIHPCWKKREVKVFNGFHPDNATSIFPQAPLMTSAKRVVGWFWLPLELDEVEIFGPRLFGCLGDNLLGMQKLPNYVGDDFRIPWNKDPVIKEPGCQWCLFWHQWSLKMKLTEIKPSGSWCLAAHARVGKEE